MFWLHATLPRLSSGFDSRQTLAMDTHQKVQPLVVLRRERTVKQEGNRLLVKVDLVRNVSDECPTSRPGR